MANALYNTFKQDLLNKVFNLATDAIKASLIDTAGYTYSPTHSKYDGASRDVPANAIVAESAALGAPTIANGVFDTNDFTWTSVPPPTLSAQAEAVILWDNTLSPSRLVLYMDTGITGMPIITNGSNVNVTVNGSGWFAL